nr:hypothetical protein [Tanacetum cinerariifolium]
MNNQQAQVKNPDSKNARRNRHRVTDEEPELFGDDALPRPPCQQRIAKSQRSSNSTASSGLNPTMFQEMMQQQYELDRKEKMDVIQLETNARVALYDSQKVADDLKVLQIAANKEESVRRGPEAGAPGSTLRRPTKDVLSWPGNANMAFDLHPAEDVLLWPGNANMAFDSRPAEDVLLWPGNANMAFDLRLTKDVLSWSGSANMVFDLRSTEDVLPWPGNANMAFDLWSTEDVLPWPGSANMAFDLVPDLKCLLRIWCEYGIRLSIGLATPIHMFYIRRYLRGMHKDNYNERHGRTADTKKESMSGRAAYRERTGPMTADTKKENMIGHAEC